MNTYEYLKEKATELSYEISDDCMRKLQIYSDELIEYNKKVNLTAVTDEKEIVIKHFIDSLSILKHCKVNENSKLIDIGTGAGFPGMVLKIARNDINLSLLDSTLKKLEFLRILSDKLSLDVNIIHNRAEILSKEKPHRESYDIATARAVARLCTLCEYVLPFVKLGGIFICMKGPDPDDEVKEATKAIETLGGKVQDIKYFSLSEDIKRSLIIIEKLKSTDIKYPRASNLISKKPILSR